MNTQQQILAEIESFIELTGTSETTFGLKAMNDGKLVDDLRNGRDLRTSNVDKIRRFMEENTPRSNN